MYDFEEAERAERQHKADLQNAIVEAILVLPERNAETMARAAYGVVRDFAEAEGHNPDIETMLKSPEESGDYMGCTPGIWIIGWESGPYMWGIDTSMAIGTSVGKLVETHFGFDLQFYPGED